MEKAINPDNERLGTAQNPEVRSAQGGDQRVFRNDAEIFEFVRTHLRVSLVCDLLDSIGYRNRAMHHRLRPILPDVRNCGFVGRARTLRWAAWTDYVEEDLHRGGVDAIDTLNLDDVVVIAGDPRGSCAMWGEVLTTIAMQNGAVGCVCDGAIRDAAAIIEMGFPVYCAAVRPLDSMGRSRVIAWDVPVECGEVLVHHGDLVFADFDGIVSVPQEVEHFVLRAALDRIQAENDIREQSRDDKSLGQALGRYRIM